MKGYYPCRSMEAVVEEIGYDPERALEDPPGSVFCAHGAGFAVSWDEVEEYMHLERFLKPEKEAGDDQADAGSGQTPLPARRKAERTADLTWEEEREIQKMIEQAYKPREKRRRSVYGKSAEKRPGMADPALEIPALQRMAPGEKGPRKKKRRKEYLLVDGYNIIFAWEELRELAKANMGRRQRKTPGYPEQLPGI